jgi:hypothetical protein
MFDTEEMAPPRLDPSIFTAIEKTLGSKGPAAAADELCSALRELGDYNALFYALLMKKRVELGVSPFPTGSGSTAELPASTHDEYEEAIRAAGRAVGELYLKQNDIRHAWFFFNMLGEPDRVREYIANYQPDMDADCQGIIEVALYQGVHPVKGFELVLSRYGICNAITTFSQQDFSRNPEAKQACIGLLVRGLHEQLLERLQSDIAGRGEEVPPTKSIVELLKGREYLFADDAYHIDTSHLSSIAQSSLELTGAEEAKLARDLCAYGEKLASHFRHEADPPFERTYADYKVLLEIIAGIDVEAGLKHFCDKIEPGAAEGNTFPAEVYVNILLKLGRKDDARKVAKQYLSGETRQMSCPNVYELCQQSKDFAGIAAAAQQRADGVSFLAAKIAGR